MPRGLLLPPPPSIVTRWGRGVGCCGSSPTVIRSLPAPAGTPVQNRLLEVTDREGRGFLWNGVIERSARPADAPVTFHWVRTACFSSWKVSELAPSPPPPSMVIWAGRALRSWPTGARANVSTIESPRSVRLWYLGDD